MPDMDRAAAIRAIATGVAHGEYSLLLGAGASLGSLGRNGRPLPTGSKLREELIEDFHVDTGGEDISLARIYDQLRRQDPDALSTYLQARFTGCEPSWQGLLTSFNWYRIWTLNIDDVVERAHEASGKDCAPFGWRDRSTARELATRQQIIHLHGRASDLSIADGPGLDGLVFSLGDYVRTLVDHRSWHRAFFDEFAERPFLIIGARLIEEFDLKEALSQTSIAKETSGYPSVLVVPGATDFQKAELRTANIEVVEASAEDFVTELQLAHRAEMVALEDVYGRVVPTEVARFLRQFIDLRAFRPANSDARFYLGYGPTWANIATDDDAELDMTRRIAGELVAAAMEGATIQRVYLMSGAPGTGKTTALLRVGKHAVGAGLRPFLFRGEETFDVESVLRWLQTVPDTVLLFDQCADFAGPIGALAARCREANVKLMAVAADRTSRLRIIESAIRGTYLYPDPPYSYGRITDADIGRLISKLDSRGRLGRMTRRSDSERRRYFRRTASSRIFDALAGLERGGGFVERVRQVADALGDPRLTKVYQLTSIAYQYGVALPFGVASSVAGLPSTELQDLLVRDASDAIILGHDGVRLPHRITASLVVDRVMNQEQRFEASLALAKALAPLVDRNAIRALTRAYRIVRLLMDQTEVHRLVGARRAREFYGALVAEYEWNGRYWEQRALLESALGDQGAARSYAERALSVHAHPFAYNTLGTILLRQAIESGDARELQEGIENLRRARDQAMWEPSEHPYITFFTSVLRFAEQWGIETVPPAVRSEWTHWFTRSNEEALFSHPARYADLLDYQRRWLSFAVS